MAANAELRPVIRKKIVVAGDKHHGGAWKVAYADFVTAMMAFFLLLWLLGSTSKDQRDALADYFNPSIPLIDISGGGKTVLKGDSVYSSAELARSGRGGVDKSDETGASEPDAKIAPPDKDNVKVVDFLAPSDVAEAEALAKQRRVLNAERAALAAEKERLEAEKAGLEAEKAGLEAEKAVLEAAKAEVAKELGVAEGDGETLKAALNAKAAAEAKDAASFDRIERAFGALKEHAAEIPALKHLSIRRAPEGVVIEIAETDGASLFDSASARPSPRMRALVEVVAPIILAVENDIAVVGHTDAAPFSAQSRYTNWELSADRANAARRLLLEFGVPAPRFRKIQGAADRDPLVEDPLAPQNRRIAITLLRNAAAPRGARDGE